MTVHLFEEPVSSDRLKREQLLLAEILLPEIVLNILG
jgi:hypothetical protein